MRPRLIHSPRARRSAGRSLAMRRSATATAFSPASLFEVAGSDGVWFDAKTSPLFADAAGTVAHTAGDPVGFWGDLSGGGRHATVLGGVTSRRPTGDTDADGLPFVQGDAVDDCLVTPSFSLGTEQATFACVVIAGGGYKVFAGFGPGYSSAGSCYLADNGNTAEVNIGGEGYVMARGGALAPSRTLLVAEVDRAAQTIVTRINGAEVSTTLASGGVISGPFENYPLHLFARRTSDTTANAASAVKLSSFFLINRHLATDERGSLEQYLMAEYEVPA